MPGRRSSEGGRRQPGRLRARHDRDEPGKRRHVPRPAIRDAGGAVHGEIGRPRDWCRDGWCSRSAKVRSQHRDPSNPLFGASVLAGGVSTGHAILRNQFLLPGGVSRTLHSPFSALYGYLAAPAVVIDQKLFDAANFRFGRGGPAGLMLVASLENLRFEENSALNLDAAFAAQANLNAIYLRRNRVRSCGNGFVLLSNRGYVLQLQGGPADPKAAQVDQYVADLLGHVASADTLNTGLAIASAYPLPPGVDPNLLIRISSTRGNITKGAQAKQSFRKNVSQFLGQQPSVAGG